MLSATPAQRARIARDPEWVASAELFRENPVPFFEVKREFVLGLARRRWLPTAAHHVVALLHRHGLLSHVLTQNIDGLHQESGVPSDLVTEVHGTTRSARCDGCGRRLALEEYAALAEAHVRDLGGADPGAPARSSDGGLPCPGCARTSVRPDTVLFGEEVNPAFREVFRRDLPAADLLVVVGTTLLVAPVATAPMEVSPECVRLVVNDRRVGENVGLVFDEPDCRRDIMVEDDIDAAFVRLAGMLGWLPDLEALSGQMSERGAECVAAAAAAERARLGRRRAAP
ncbi:unnamed protein product [Prorocentrum cordatum]|nr:unnamed protein product [Polarella glacialis]